MKILSQRNSKWASIPLGFTLDTTIGTHGCTITCIAMILETTPDEVNEKLKVVKGFANGNLVIWAKVAEAFPGIQIHRVWNYNNEDVKVNVPNVIVEVDGKPIGGPRHWLVYIGNQKALDPWDGKEKSTASYPNPLSYCIIKPPKEDLASTPLPDFDNVIAGYKARLTDLEKQLQEAKAELTNRIEEIARKEAERQGEIILRNELTGKLNEAIRKYSDIQGVYEGRISELQGQVDTRSKEIGTLKIELGKCQGGGQNVLTLIEKILKRIFKK